MSKISFYEGTYLFKVGYPFALTVSDRHPDGDFVGEVFVLIQKVPSQDFTLTSQRLKYLVSTRQFESVGVKNIEEFIAEECHDWLLGHLHHLQSEMAIKEHAFPVRDCELAPQDYKSSLLRLRLRGLSEAIINQICRVTKSDELARFLKTLVNFQPITVERVPS